MKKSILLGICALFMCTFFAKAQQSYKLSQLLNLLEKADSAFEKIRNDDMDNWINFQGDTVERRWNFQKGNKILPVKLLVIKRDSAYTIEYNNYDELAGRSYARLLAEEGKDNKLNRKTVDTVTEGYKRKITYRVSNDKCLVTIVEDQTGDTDPYGKFFPGKRFSSVFYVRLEAVKRKEG